MLFVRVEHYPTGQRLRCTLNVFGRDRTEVAVEKINANLCIEDMGMEIVFGSDLAILTTILGFPEDVNWDILIDKKKGKQTLVFYSKDHPLDLEQYESVEESW